MSEQKKIYAAMTGVMRDMVAIGKDKKNVQQGFNYRGIDDAYNALQPLLADHGIFNTPEVLEKWREERTTKSGTVLAFTVLRIKYTFYADDGSSVYCIVEGEGMDSGDKSSNKAMAVAHKYALLQVFCVPTVITDDPDQQVHEVVAKSTEAVKNELRFALKALTNEVEVKSLYKQGIVKLGAREGSPEYQWWVALCKERMEAVKNERMEIDE